MKEHEILSCKILIIDDNDTNLKLLEDLLEREGFEQILSTTESINSINLVSAFKPDIILLDLMMPKLDGYAVLEQLSKKIPDNEYLPVLILTSDITVDAKRRALSLGANDFLSKPFDTIEAMLRVWNLLETRVLYKHIIQHDANIPAIDRSHFKYKSFD